MNNNCNGCAPGGSGFPGTYPYNRPARDSYGFCTCGDPRKETFRPIPCADACHHPGPNPNPNLFPVDGPFVGNGLSLIETYPYLVDTTCLRYGPILSYSESAITKVTRRNDPSCINLTASFDLTNTNLNNTVLNDFFKKYTAKKYDILQGVLPILKKELIFEIYYTITDSDGGVVHTSVIQTTTNDERFHFTDIKDMYITSAKGLVLENIPAMTYNGLYTFTIDSVKVFMPLLDTRHFINDNMNPFYQFVDNNMRIQLQHDIIENTPSKDMILIGETPVNIGIAYTANLSNRVRLSFTAFMSNLIAARDTVGIWEALNEPTDEIVNQLRQDMTTLEETVTQMQTMLTSQDTRIQDLEKLVNINKNDIAEQNKKIDQLNALVTTLGDNYKSLEERVETLENRPLALIAYVVGKEFKTSQITWKVYGELYQCTKAFTASGNIDADIEAGYLVPVIKDASDYDVINTKIDELTEKVTTNAAGVLLNTTKITSLTEEVDSIKNELSEMTTYTTFTDLGINSRNYETMTDLYKALVAKNVGTNTIITGMIYNNLLPSEFHGIGNAEISIQVVNKSFLCTCTSLDTAPYSWNSLYGKGIEVFGWTPTFANVDTSIEFLKATELPTIGKSDVLYITTDTKSSYLWDDENQTYVKIDNVSQSTIQSTVQ